MMRNNFFYCSHLATLLEVDFSMHLQQEVTAIHCLVFGKVPSL